MLGRWKELLNSNERKFAGKRARRGERGLGLSGIWQEATRRSSDEVKRVAGIDMLRTRR